ncbi:MAG: penicillin-binding protein [Proteobacteria bacterium]|nr:MAG: penicillin-binding protein [Pseudomonadota bacterium]PIE17891.1 MAG: penicillin-binding protein [Pseudomonadota bacterium]
MSFWSRIGRTQTPGRQPTERDVTPPTRWIKGRLLLTICAMFCLFGVVGWRAYRLQIVEGPRLSEMARQQYLKQIELPSKRGSILDRHGAPLAVSVDVDSIYANPRMLSSKAPLVAQTLAPMLDLDAAKLAKRLSTRRYFAWVKRRVPRTLARRIKALNIRGLFLQPESRRYYPNRGLAATVVGFAGIDSKGLEGIERSLDRWLRGPPQRIAGLRDALGRRLWTPPPNVEMPVHSSSHDVVLSIDRAIQHETEAALQEIMTEHNPKWAAAVVLDPATGDVLAMASVPAFDPNRFSDASPKTWRNRAITDAFEPGSTLKIFSVAAALATGHAKDSELIDAGKGRVRIGRHWIHDSKPHDELSLRDVLKKSSNVCVSRLALRMGNKLLYRYLRAFGFARRTGIPLSGERRGTLRNPRRWSKVGLANIAFGQGMTATVLQIARAMTALGNDGVLMEPRLVLRLRNTGSDTERELPPKGRRVISPSLAKRMRYLLGGVTERGGTAEEAALERYTVAGKTGTAQKVDRVTGTYAEDKWLSSFVALTPASKPRLAIAIVVDEPSGEEHYGGKVAGPAFRRIAQKALRYLGVRPDKAAARPKKSAAPQRLRARKSGPQDEDALAPPLPGEGPRGAVLVPDFTGMSIAEALSAARKAHLVLEVLGSGQATAQSPGPGPSRQGRCRVSFRPPG